MATVTTYGENIHANGIRQHVVRFHPESDAEPGLDPVVVIPGITSPAITWGFVGARFGRLFDTYILDVRGRGLSSSGDDLDYGVDAQADDVIALLGALDLSGCSLVGHSMGARIATRAVRRGAAGVNRVALVDPPVSGPGRREYPSKLPWYVDSIREARRGMDADAMRAYCPSWSEEQCRLRAEWLHTCDERAVRKSFADFHEDDFHSDLPDLACPTLLIRAGRGGVILDEDVEEMEALAPNLVTRTVAEAGHMIPWDDEEGFYASFQDFLGAPLR